MSIITKDILNSKEEFHKNGCVKLHSLFSDPFLSILKNGYSLETEKRSLLENHSSEITVIDKVLNARISIILNSPEFIKLISDFTNENILKAKHRLYYIDNTCVSLPWHDDSYSSDNRVAAMRLELSDEIYTGGDFVFRNENSEHRFSNLKFGEAVIFKVQSQKMYHKVESVLDGKRKSLSLFLCV